MGDVVTDQGLKPDPEKVQAIVNLEKPEDKKALQRFLGMVKYLSQYIPNESDITSPLRNLVKDGAQWCWEAEHDIAFNKVKQILISEPVLGYYDVTKPVTIQADASSFGLGACLLQDGRPISYASRTLTAAEQTMLKLSGSC